MIKRFRDRVGTNTLIGIFLLLALFSLAGDEVVRGIVAQVPGRGINEAPPCRWLPSPEDPANNQSLIGRAAVNNNSALELSVRAGRLPTQAGQYLLIRILVSNHSMGTVPFIYDPTAVIIGDNNTSGLGIVFNPPSNIFTPGINTRADAATYPNERIRLLGPQQRCVHTVELEFNQLDASILSGNATVRAYYRGNNVGAVPPANPTPIYPDQGLPTGVITSPTVPLLRASS